MATLSWSPGCCIAVPNDAVTRSSKYLRTRARTPLLHWEPIRAIGSVIPKRERPRLHTRYEETINIRVLSRKI